MRVLHGWVRQVVLDWIAGINDVETLQVWFDAVRERLRLLGAPRRGFKMEVGATVYAGAEVFSLCEWRFDTTEDHETYLWINLLHIGPPEKPK